MKDYRPQNRTLLKLVNYLEDIGLEVVGGNCDVDTGEEYEGMKCFSAEDTVKYRKLLENDDFWREGDA